MRLWTVPLDDFTPAPGTRTILTAATGSGKSTVESSIVENYHRLYPRHRIVIGDPKRRFRAIRRPGNAAAGLVFPDGYNARLLGKRRGVRVYAKLIGPRMGFRWDHPVWIIQDQAKLNEYFAWLYRHQDARRPVLLVLDESFDLVKGTQPNPDLRRLYREGREMSVGVFNGCQRPIGIDRVWLTEAENLIVGTIRHPDDLVYLRKNAQADPRLFAKPLPRYQFLFVDQTGERPPRIFRLRM